MVRAEAVVLVTMKVWVSVIPSGTDPKARADADRARPVPGVTVRVAGAVVAEPRALVKTASSLVPLWARVGEKV